MTVLTARPASSDVFAVDVDSAWTRESKTFGALVHYELCYRRSVVFHKEATHRFVPRALGAGTALAKAKWELTIAVPAFAAKPGKVTLAVSIKALRKVKRRFREGTTRKWVPIKGWDKREISVDLRKAALGARLGRTAVRAQVSEFFGRLEAFQKEHPKLGGLLTKAIGWALDVSEDKIDQTIVGLARARVVADAVLRTWRRTR